MYQVSWIDYEGALNTVNTPCIYAAEGIGRALWQAGHKVRTWKFISKGVPKFAWES